MSEKIPAIEVVVQIPPEAFDQIKLMLDRHQLSVEDSLSNFRAYIDSKFKPKAIWPVRLVRWLNGTKYGHKVLWNPILKYSERMHQSYSGVERQINVSMSGPTTDFCGLVSLCGIGCGWGFPIKQGETYKYNFHPVTNRAIGKLKFGRIKISPFKRTV